MKHCYNRKLLIPLFRIPGFTVSHFFVLDQVIVLQLCLYCKLNYETVHRERFLNREHNELTASAHLDSWNFVHYVGTVQLNYNFIFPRVVTRKYSRVKFENFLWKSWFTQGIKNHEMWNAIRCRMPQDVRRRISHKTWNTMRCEIPWWDMLCTWQESWA